MSTSTHHSSGVTGKQLVAATIKFFDHLAGKDRSLQALVTGSSDTWRRISSIVVPTFLWIEALLYSLPDNTRLKEMIKVDFEAQSDVMYPSEALEITITILGTGRHVNEVDIVKSFLHHVKVPHGGDPTWRGDYISSGSRIHFCLHFVETIFARHPVTHLRFPKKSGEAIVKILAIDPPEIIDEALCQFRTTESEATHLQDTVVALRWLPILIFHNVLTSWNGWGRGFPLPDNFTVNKAHHDFRTLLLDNNSGAQTAASLRSLSEKLSKSDLPANLREHLRAACATFIPYYENAGPSLFASAGTVPSHRNRILPPFPNFPETPHEARNRREADVLQDEPFHPYNF